MNLQEDSAPLSTTAVDNAVDRVLWSLAQPREGGMKAHPGEVLRRGALARVRLKTRDRGRQPAPGLGAKGLDVLGTGSLPRTG